MNEAAIENFKTQITSLKLNQGQIMKELEVLKQDKADKYLVQENTNNINEIILNHSKTLEEHHNQSLTIENFMEKYMPIKVQTQISDTLKAIVDKKLRKNLENFETQKFEELHTLILSDNGDPSIISQLHSQNSEPKSPSSK